MSDSNIRNSQETAFQFILTRLTELSYIQFGKISIHFKKKKRKTFLEFNRNNEMWYGTMMSNINNSIF